MKGNKEGSEEETVEQEKEKSKLSIFILFIRRNDYPSFPSQEQSLFLITCMSRSVISISIIGITFALCLKKMEKKTYVMVFYLATNIAFFPFINFLHKQ